MDEELTRPAEPVNEKCNLSSTTIDSTRIVETHNEKLAQPTTEIVKISHRYKKRKGTSITMTVISNKTSFLSLILYRNLVLKRDFILGCNVDNIGCMGEICYRFQNHSNKPVVVFIKTMFQNAISDKDVDDANFLKYFQDFLMIIERFKSKTDPFFKGCFEDVKFYFIIYSPNACKIKDCIGVSNTNQIFTDKVNDILCDGQMVNKLFQIPRTTLIDDTKIYEVIEYIGKTIAATITSVSKDLDKANDEMKNAFIQYYHYLIPNVMEINRVDMDCFGVFSESLFKSDDKYHEKLKEVVFSLILKKKLQKYENSEEQISLFLQGGEFATLIANGLTFDDNNKPVIFGTFSFDESNNKLVIIPDLPLQFKHEIIKKINGIKITKAIMDSALDIAMENTLRSIKIKITNATKEAIADLNKQTTQTVSYFENEILKSKLIQSLYIYAEQGNLVKQLREEIEKNEIVNTNGSIYQRAPELLCLQLHNKVQEWFLLQNKSYYLTNINCDFLKIGSIFKFQQLNILNLRCVNKLEGHSLKFKKDSTKLFESSISNTQSRNIINVTTENVLISSIKLLQYLKYFGHSNENYSFIDIEHVLIMKDMDYEMLLEDITEANIDTFVIVMYKTVKKIDRLHEIIDKLNKKILIVSKLEISDIDIKYILKHDSNSLDDIDNVDEIVEYKITVQGTKTKLSHVIGTTKKSLVKADILSKIIKQEEINIGNKLTDPEYEKIEHYFIERTIKKLNTDTKAPALPLKTFLDVLESVVTIVGPPGIGKSKFMTHMSMKTKLQFPNIWVVRMNLLYYSEDFYWLKKKTTIGLKECMDLVCKAEIGNGDKFTLDELDGVIVLNNKELKGTALLHLELIIEAFNAGYIIFIFDGFDEICPDYKIVAMQFIKKMVDINRHYIWIASREYTQIIGLLDEFSTLYYLQHFAEHEITPFYHYYWKKHIKLETLNKEQFANIELFFEYMNKSRRQCDDLPLKLPNTSIFPLRLMHEAAIDYFRSEISSTNLDINSVAILDKWISKDELPTLDKFRTMRFYKDALKLAGSPLHMQIYADLFVSEILSTSSDRKWELDVHTFEFYKRFLETKLMTIRFKEKCRENIYLENEAFYKEEKERVILMHKWLALYFYFHKNINFKKIIIMEEKIETIQKWIKAIERGEEKTGLIEKINSRGVLQFVHLVFSEYFAVECIADLLKKYGNKHQHTSSSKPNIMQTLINFLINSVLRVSNGILNIFDHKLKNDDELRNILRKARNHRFIFKTMITQNVLNCNSMRDTTLNMLLENGSKDTVELLLQSTEGNLNRNNVKPFVKHIGKDFFILALHFDDLIVYVLNSIRIMDPSMVRKVLDMCDLNKLDERLNDVEILEHMKREFTPIPQLTPRISEQRNVTKKIIKRMNTIIAQRQVIERAWNFTSRSNQK